MATSHRKSRIPALSASSCKLFKPTSGFDLSSHTSLAYETSYRYGSCSTQRKSSTSHNPNKYNSCYSVSSIKGAKGLFAQSPKTERKAHYASSATASGRRSSIMGDRSRQKDTRQLASSDYQQACTTKLIQFLTNNAYPSPISPKFLKSPSKQDVIKIFEFLFSRLSPDIEVVPMETRIPELMAQFGYPYYFGKSSLISFSSRQAIGNLLGIFEFLVDTVQYMKSWTSENLFYSSVTSDDASIKTSILQIVADDENEDVAFNELAAKLYGTDEDLKNLESEEKKLDLEIENLEKENETRKSVPAKKLEYKKFTTEYLAYNDYMQDYIQKNEEESIKLKEEIAELEKELALNTEKCEEINQKVNNQPYDAAEMTLARERQRQFDKEINDDTKFIKQTKHQIHSIVNDISSTKDQLTKKNDGYASEVNSLLMDVNTQAVKNYVPWVIEKLHSSELESILEQLSSPESLTKSSELKKRFVDSINEINKYLIEVKVDLSSKLVKVQQKGKQLNLVEEEKIKELKTLQENLEKAEQDLQKYKQACHEESKLLNEKFAQLRKTLTEKELSVKECIQSNESRIDQLRNELSQQTVKNKELKEQNGVILLERRAKEAKLLNVMEKSLSKILDMERKAVDTLKTAVNAYKPFPEKIKRRIEEQKLKEGDKTARSSSDKTQDLSKAEKTVSSSMSQTCSKENICIN